MHNIDLLVGNEFYFRSDAGESFCVCILFAASCMLYGFKTIQGEKRTLDDLKQ